MTPDFERLPPLGDEVEAIVAIPARNEEARIVTALAALAGQRFPDGTRFPATRYETIVFANECSDRTVARANAFARAHAHTAVHVIAGELPRDAAHVGMARKLVMDAAADRFRRAGRAHGIIATTDADTVVDGHWLAATLDEVGRADAVVGRIMLARGDRAKLAPATRRLYLQDMAYRRIVGELEAARDPIACDPAPRHGQHFGASFAVRTDAYVRAGGVPPQPKLEDLALYEALQRIDARVRHSMRVRVETSARTFARVEGGFATFLRDLHANGERDDRRYVEAAAVTLARIDARAALRRLWSGGGDARSAERALDTVTASYGITRYRFRRTFDPDETFGVNLQRFEARASETFAMVAAEPISFVLETLRCALAASKVARPRRSSTASGAG